MEEFINNETLSYNATLLIVEKAMKLKDKNVQYIEAFDNLVQNDKINIDNLIFECISNKELLVISSKISSKDAINMFL